MSAFPSCPGCGAIAGQLCICPRPTPRVPDSAVPNVSVAGRRVERTLNELERAALLCLGTEQEKIAPDNALIAVLCDTVRLIHEHSDSRFIPDSAVTPQPEPCEHRYQRHDTVMTYKEFVFSKLRAVLGETDEQIIDFMIRDWISTHPDYVGQAGATIAEWRAQQGGRVRRPVAGLADLNDPGPDSPF